MFHVNVIWSIPKGGLCFMLTFNINMKHRGAFWPEKVDLFVSAKESGVFPFGDTSDGNRNGIRANHSGMNILIADCGRSPIRLQRIRPRGIQKNRPVVIYNNVIGFDGGC